MQYDYKKLQNGSDIRGVAIAGVQGEDINLDEETTIRIAKAFAFWLSNKTSKPSKDLVIAIGTDSRLSAESLKNYFINGLLSCGVTVLDSGLSSTPAMFMANIFNEFNANGSVMITASHLPYNRNGFKFFDKDGGLEKGDITDIITFAESNSILGQLIPSNGNVSTINLIERYSQHLREIIIEKTGSKEPLKGMHILIDAGNGSGGFFEEKVIKPLGADTSGSQFLNPDGSFPNHAPNPEDKDAMDSICKAVKKYGADLGIIFDTDVDRSSAVDEKGNQINRNGIIALATTLINQDYPNTTVVTDSVTSTHLTSFLEDQLGVKHLRFKRGYKNVINKAKELNDSGIDSQLAIETSGHAAYKENYFLDDGAYLATKIIIKAALLHREGKPVSSLLVNLTEPAESIEKRIPIINADFSTYGDMVLHELEAYILKNQKSLNATIVSPNYEGLRVSIEGENKGWFLLRKSLHDPIMPLSVESDCQGGCDRILRVVLDFLVQYRDLKI